DMYNTAHRPGTKGGYFPVQPTDSMVDLRAEMMLVLEQVGLEVILGHHEVAQGQGEIGIVYSDIITASDNVQKYKYVVKMIAHLNGKTATFMPKPLYGDNGNGMHVHLSLWKDGKNLFYKKGEYGNLSQMALQYTGGIFNHAAAVASFTNPSTNSYKRLIPGFEAPVNAFFSLGNRSAAVRIPKYANQPDTVRIEFRPPDATCNVYLALAAQLLAGLDGIKRRIDPKEAGFGPVDADIFSWTASQRDKIKRLPSSLKDALLALDADKDFLLAGGVFNEELIGQWIEHKMKNEYYQVQNRPHPYEMTLYF
ncbi:MAG: glutamine synthetase, partial [Desulfuromonadales bacterium]|nr:glutamine synthetase [Desulfuromonadales bacterium]